MSWRDVLVVAGTVATGVVVVAAVGAAIEPGYTTSATLVAAQSSVPGGGVSGVGLDTRYYRSQDPETLLDTTASWRDAVAGQAARRLGDLSPANVAARVRLEPEDDPPGVRVIGRDASPQRAARLANAFAREYIRLDYAWFFSKVREAETRTSLRLAIARKAGLSAHDRRALDQQRQTLRVLRAVGPRRIMLTRLARAHRPTRSRHLARDVRVAAVLGLLVGLGMVFFLRALRPGHSPVVKSVNASEA